MCQLDEKNVFVYWELDREELMEQPRGCVSKQFPNYVCHLKKALYGLNQEPTPDAINFQQLVESLIYVTITKPEISYLLVSFRNLSIIQQLLI